MIKQHKQYSVHPLLDLCGTVSPEDARCIVCPKNKNKKQKTKKQKQKPKKQKKIASM
jgi:hypothetical protein